MAKSKMKLDQAVIQQFFIDHTEKIVMGLLGLFFCYLAYDSFTRPHYEKQPADLQAAVNAAKDRIKNGPSPDDKPAAKFKIPTFAAEVEQARMPKDPFAIKPLNLNQVSPRKPRGMPMALPVRNVVAVAGRSTFLVNTTQVGRRWVVVTGLVPTKEQEDIYVDKFRGCSLVDPERDHPIYEGFFVERVEVEGNAELDWSQAKTKFFYSPTVLEDPDNQFSGAEQPEIVDDEFVHPALTFNLPPALDWVWGKEAAHDPEIPVSKQKAAAAAAAMQMPGGPAMHGPGAGLRPGNPRGGRPIPPPVNPGEHRGGPVGGHHHFANNNVPGAAPIAVAPQAATPDFKLLRFFDFKVEPGKTYRYRIFVLLANPNEGMTDVKAVENPAFENPDNWYIGHDKEQLDDKNVLWAEPDPKYASWSEPSPPVTTLLDQGIFAGKVELPRGAEVQGEIHPFRWLAETGDKVIEHVPVKRGKVNDIAPRPDPKNRKGPKFDFSTNDCVVDMRGGEELSKKDKEFTAPGQILTLDRDGRLVIHDELDDADAMAKFESSAKAGNVPGRKIPGPPMPGRPGPRGHEARPVDPDLVQ